MIRLIARLLLELQKDARQTNKALAEKAGVAPSTCLERVRELQARGVIRGFRADVDPAAVGRPMEAILSIQQRPAQGRGMIETMLEHVRKFPETLRVMALTGTTDFIIHVAVRDMDHLRDLVWATDRATRGGATSELADLRARGGAGAHAARLTLSGR